MGPGEDTAVTFIGVDPLLHLLIFLQTGTFATPSRREGRISQLIQRNSPCSDCNHAADPNLGGILESAFMALNSGFSDASASLQRREFVFLFLFLALSELSL